MRSKKSPSAQPADCVESEERERVANHVRAVAILGLILPRRRSVSRVTITPHGQALGVTYQRQRTIDTTTRRISARALSVRWAGAPRRKSSGLRALPGAENDMQQATSIARQMVTRWGMSDSLGPGHSRSAVTAFLANGG
jgi:cell division protease FtsH